MSLRGAYSLSTNLILFGSRKPCEYVKSECESEPNLLTGASLDNREAFHVANH